MAEGLIVERDLLDGPWPSPRRCLAGRGKLIGRSWLDRVVEREGFIKCITVIHLTRGCVIAGCDLLDVSWQRRAPRAAIAESGKTFTEANEGNQGD